MTYLIYPNLCTTSKPSLRRGNKTGNNTSVSDRVQKLLIIPLSRFTSQPLGVTTVTSIGRGGSGASGNAQRM
ncbi:hypothetical protein SCLCIDRAFT_1216646 [Scleroderma citrinum Foug A]|uniref:Uncharacterized protein n=1 Tax=Scleroderma citrinum Foug A TaxID=1036808 RepID=A0A0C3A6Y4_9AGAM|nr:hypothetical protein SCLCIDRAFT_1216646 [Scleroderma citrinum Foug A]